MFTAFTNDKAGNLIARTGATVDLAIFWLLDELGTRYINFPRSIGIWDHSAGGMVYSVDCDRWIDTGAIVALAA